MAHPIMLLLIVGLIGLANFLNNGSEDGEGLGDILILILFAIPTIVLPIIGIIMLIMGKLN